MRCGTSRAKSGNTEFRGKNSKKRGGGIKRNRGNGGNADSAPPKRGRKGVPKTVIPVKSLEGRFRSQIANHWQKVRIAGIAASESAELNEEKGGQRSGPNETDFKGT